MKARTILLFAANFGNTLFFSLVLTQMLLFGGASHQTLLFEDSLLIILTEVVVVWCLVVVDVAWIVQALRGARQQTQRVNAGSLQAAAEGDHLMRRLKQKKG